MTEPGTSVWEKGGLRYQKLKKLVPAFLAPADVEAFFVGVRGRGGMPRLANPFTPLQREYVIAATSDGVVVLRLRLPGVFRASIAGVAHWAPRDGANVQWQDGQLIVDGDSYGPIAFHEEDAERVAALLGSL